MKLLEKIANRYTFWAALLIYSVFGFYLMPRAMKGSAVTPLDLHFSYSPEIARQTLAQMGTQGRASYVHFSHVLDTPYPLIYTALFVIVILLLVKTLWPGSGRWRWLGLVPLLAMGFDFLENHSIISMIHSWPSVSDKAAQTASLFSSLKWSFIGVNAGLIFVLLILLAGRKLRR